MAKTRVTVNESELKLVEQAKELAKLRTKRRQKADELKVLDKQIESAQIIVNGLVDGEAEE